MNSSRDTKIGFGSDNHSGALPEMFEAISKCNLGHLPSYGTDWVTQAAEQKILAELGSKDGEVHFVFNGTAANVLSLHCLVESYHSVIVSEGSHLYVDECAAPEKQIGCKLIPVPTKDGKLTPQLLKPFIIRRGDQHFAQVKAISITQPTELGTVYSLEELSALKEFARANKLSMHMDGARLFNAAISLSCSLSQLTDGFDVVALGGTKNGLVFGEAVIILNKDIAADFKYKRKQAMQLPSKTRFIAAQFDRLFSDDLWRRTAHHSVALAKELNESLSKLPFVKITQKTESNAVFAILPRQIVSKLKEKFFFYVWDEHTFEVRLMTTFDTSQHHINSFVSEIRDLYQQLGSS